MFIYEIKKLHHNSTYLKLLDTKILNIKKNHSPQNFQGLQMGKCVPFDVTEKNNKVLKKNNIKLT